MIYDAKKHPIILKQIYCRSKSQKQIASELNISLSTLKNWLSKHKEFKNAWKNLLNSAKTIDVKPLTKKSKLMFEAKNNNHKVVLLDE